jgi:predicted glycoside hydrolase/deacetylase ChbG (UPF0249 family)
MSAALRLIWLCADDYGISPAVNEAIRDLIARGRINATSVMVVTPSFHRSDAVSLNLLNAGEPRVAIGLHVTLTGPFKPLRAGFEPLRDGAFLPLEQMLKRALLRRLSPKSLEVEMAAQLEAFVVAFGRMPDFVDGHQHVHQFPQIRDAFLKVIKEHAQRAWVRQCGRARIPLSRRLFDKKAMLLDGLSRTFRKRAKALSIAVNPAFAGTYDFAAAPPPDFAALFPRFLEQLPSGGLVMCHPGRVDSELERLDALTHQREREYDYLASDKFAAVLRSQGVALAEMQARSEA